MLDSALHMHAEIIMGRATPPRNGSIETYQNTAEGTEIFFSCNQMFVPSTRMTATCTWMAPLRHIKTQLKELRYSSDVTQGLSQLGG